MMRRPDSTPPTEDDVESGPGTDPDIVYARRGFMAALLNFARWVRVWTFIIAIKLRAVRGGGVWSLRNKL